MKQPLIQQLENLKVEVKGARIYGRVYVVVEGPNEKPCGRCALVNKCSSDLVEECTLLCGTEGYFQRASSVVRPAKQACSVKKEMPVELL